MKKIDELADEVVEEMENGVGFHTAVTAVLISGGVKGNWDITSSQIKATINERNKAIFPPRQRKEMIRDSHFLSLRRGDNRVE